MIRKSAVWAKILCWMGLVMGCGTLTLTDDRFTKMCSSPNFEKGRFVNLAPVELMQNGGFKSVMKQWFLDSNQRKPTTTLPFQPLDASAFQEPPADFRAIWLGHSFLIVDIDGIRVIIDPVFDNAAPVPWAVPRFQAPPIKREQLPHADVVILSHNHYDHLEKRTIQHLAPSGVTFVVPLGVGERLVRWGVAEAHIVELDWWESCWIQQVELVCTPSQHFSSRTLWDRNKTLWGSWVLKGTRHRAFFSSDGGWGEHFAAIGRRFGPFDVTFIDIGAYADQWPQVHLRPEQSIQAHQALQGKTMIPIHWAAYDLALHPWDEPIERAWAAAMDRAVSLETPMMGQPFDGQQGSTHRWWNGQGLN